MILFITSITTTSGQINFEPAVCYSIPTPPRHIISGDFNEDNKVDLATADWGGNTASVLLGNGNGTFMPAVTYAADSTPQSIATADFDNDGHLDLVTANMLGNNLSMLFGLGNGTFLPAVSITTGLHPWVVQAADFNDDGNADLAVTEYGIDSIAILLGNGLGGFSSPSRFGTGGNGPNSLVCADFNNDTTIDMLVGNWISKDYSILLGDGTGNFTQPITSFAGGEFTLIAADFNNDTTLDIAIGYLSQVWASIALGNGTGSFPGGYGAVFGYGGVRTSLCAADFNNDGKLDLVGNRRPTDTIDVLEGVGGADSFLSYSPHFALCGHITYFIMSDDFNGDGYTDLAVANDGSSNVSIFLNALPTSTEEVTSKTEQLVAFPNPTTDKLFIKTASNTKRELYNCVGQLLITTMENEIDVSNYPKGIYTLQVENIFRKIIIN